MQVKRNIRVGKTIYYTNYQYITNKCACIEFPHYLTVFVVCFPLYGFDPYIKSSTCVVNVPSSKLPLVIEMQF